MAPLISRLLNRSLDPSVPSQELSDQWKNPGDVFSILLILGGDVVGRALAQLSGTRITPVTFSFGWVAYAVTAVVSAIGENKLMPLPDCSCKVINGKSGYSRENSSWILGRMVRDYGSWMDPSVRTHLNKMLDKRWEENRHKANRKQSGSIQDIQNFQRPTQAGLCVSIYRAGTQEPGNPISDGVYFSGICMAAIQLGVAAIPCGIFGDWSILLITTAGIILSFLSGSLSQWSIEKWACRRNSDKNVVLTRGNGTQHAIVIRGEGRGLDLEDLATGPVGVSSMASHSTRAAVVALAILWLILLVTASGITENTWFLLAVGGLGILQNIFVAGSARSPEAFGVPLTFVEVIGETKVMKTLFAVEEKYPGLGRNLLEVFFPGNLSKEEETRWAELNAANSQSTP